MFGTVLGALRRWPTLHMLLYTSPLPPCPSKPLGPPVGGGFRLKIPGRSHESGERAEKGRESSGRRPNWRVATGRGLDKSSLDEEQDAGENDGVVGTWGAFGAASSLFGQAAAAAIWRSFRRAPRWPLSPFELCRAIVSAQPCTGHASASSPFPAR